MNEKTCTHRPLGEGEAKRSRKRNQKRREKMEEREAVLQRKRDLGIQEKKIPGHDRLYSAFSDGTIVNHQTARIMKTTPSRNGYRTIGLYSNGKTRTFYAHRIIASAFFGEPGEGFQVNHKNADKADNRPENLEWVTHQGNMNHAKDLRLHPRGENHFRSKFKDHEVEEIKSLKGIESQESIARRFGVSQGTISSIHTNKTWAK